MNNCIYHGPVARSRKQPLQIDLAEVMNKKLGRRRMSMIPNAFVRYIEHVICVPAINRLLRENYPKTGGEFARGILKSLNINVDFHNTDNLPPAENRRVLFVSNHPMGGIEGMAMIDMMERYYGGQIYVMVNDILMALEPLQNVFVPVNKHGHQGVQTAKRIEEALSSDNPVLIFPAGWVSRLNSHNCLHDIPWHKTFVNKAIEHRRNIIPMFCDGRNSMFFYRFAKLRESLGIKLNVEMVRLPREVLKMRNRCFNIICGKPIDWFDLRGGAHAQQTAYEICNRVYAMQP